MSSDGQYYKILHLLVVITAMVMCSLPGSLMLKLAFGYTVKPEGEDYLINLGEEVIDKIITKACENGAWAVDFFPFCEIL